MSIQVNHINQRMMGLAVATVVAGGISISGCEQDPLVCVVAQQFFAATYEVKSNEGSCEPVAAEGISAGYHLGEGGEFGPGDPFNAGMSLIVQQVANAYTDHQGDEGFELKSEYRANFGKFEADYPDDNDVCRPDMDEFSETEFSYPATDDVPGDTVRSSWSEVEVRVTSNSPGLYFEGEVTVERDCGSITYGVRAFSPIIGCFSDEDCERVTEIYPEFEAECGIGVRVSWMTNEDSGYDGTCILK